MTTLVISKMTLLEEIRKSEKKSKELVAYLIKRIREDKNLLNDLPSLLDEAGDVEKGILIEVLEHLTKEDPEYGRPFINAVARFISYKAPKVKWEASRFIGNVACKYPAQAGEVVARLLANTSDKGTVVRWSTAFALGEIAKYDAQGRTNLVAKIKRISEKESNNGVRNVYLKALKAIEKES